MTRSALLTVAAMLASSYLAVGGVMSWMIWPMMEAKPAAERVGYVVQIVARWPALVAGARKAAAE